MHGRGTGLSSSRSAATSIAGPRYREPDARQHVRAGLLAGAGKSRPVYRGGLRMSQPSAHAPLDDRARLKERDENVRFKQSMTPHISCEELVPRKLWRQMEMQADLFLDWLALFVGLGAVAIFL